MTTSIKTLIAITAIVGLLCGCQTPYASQKAWEYKVVEQNLYPGKLEEQINQLAAAGWQFVSVSTASQGESAVPRGFIVVRRPREQ